MAKRGVILFVLLAGVAFGQSFLTPFDTSLLQLATTDDLWTPGEIITAFWIDASIVDRITFVSGEVDTVDDRSGNGHTAYAYSSLLRPAWSNNVQNGLGVLWFEQSDALMAITNASGNTTGMYTAVVCEYDDASLSQYYYALYARADGDNRWYVAVAFTDVRNYACATGEGFASDNDTAAGIQALSISNTSVTAYLNGENTGSKSATLATPFDRVRIGGGADIPLFDGWVGEVIHLNYYPDTDIRQKIEGYLAHKWGLESKLPSGHPYKESAP